MASELTAEQLDAARAAALAGPPLTESERARLTALYARQDHAERERRMQAAYVATMRPSDPPTGEGAA